MNKYEINILGRLFAAMVLFSGFVYFIHFFLYGWSGLKNYGIEEGKEIWQIIKTGKTPFKPRWKCFQK